MTRYFAVVQRGNRNVTPLLTSPDGGVYVHLFSYELLAQDFGENQTKIADWEIVEILDNELDSWLMARRDRDSATHLLIGLAHGIGSQEHEIDGYLLFRQIPWNPALSV
jgi:hypothetical protein